MLCRARHRSGPYLRTFVGSGSCEMISSRTNPILYAAAEAQSTRANVTGSPTTLLDSTRITHLPLPLLKRAKGTVCFWLEVEIEQNQSPSGGPSRRFAIRSARSRAPSQTFGHSSSGARRVGEPSVLTPTLSLEGGACHPSAKIMDHMRRVLRPLPIRHHPHPSHTTSLHRASMLSWSLKVGVSMAL